MKRVILWFALTVFAGFAQADDLQMIISGKSLHSGADDLNEDNYGIGLQYDFNPEQRWIPIVGMASFKDSNRNTSHYIGAGIKRRFKLLPSPQTFNVDIGVFGLVMKRPEYNDEHPFFGATPFVSFSNDRIGVNATYVPKVDTGAYPFWYFQLSLKLVQF